jgi:acetolactate synthase I/II/III large subunit
VAISGIPDQALRQARTLRDATGRVRKAFEWRGVPDGLAVACVQLLGSTDLADRLADDSLDAGECGRAIDSYLEEVRDIQLTGADVVALVSRCHGVSVAFAYGGTSELMICDRLSRIGTLKLVNSRGDKEAAFFAAGASLLEPWRSVAVIHGARGLTNACGAIADARRSELATLCLVGLPSTGSAPFLPPHGEDGLLEAISHFTKGWWQAPPVSEDPAERRGQSIEFVQSLQRAFAVASTRPHGPRLFGIPQDVAEAAWLDLDVVAEILDLEPTPPKREPATDVVVTAATLIKGASSPVLLIDDYALRYPAMRPLLARLADLADAPVLQLRYTRGPMMHERLSSSDVPSFLGWYDPGRPEHVAVMEGADLLVTIEDRNMYPRVLGPLPPCQKLALTSDLSKVEKNKYLVDGDLTVVGDVDLVLRGILDRLGSADVSAGPSFEDVGGPPEHVAVIEQEIGDGEDIGRAVRRSIGQVVGEALDQQQNPVLVDDSSMFGGLVANEYDMLPARTRVLGAHGGFIGSSAPLATGVALGNPAVGVLCFTGDQGFTNSCQALVAAGECGVGPVYVVANNGEAVSLLKQGTAQDPTLFDYQEHPHLHNGGAFSYTGVAKNMGVECTMIDLSDLSSPEKIAGELRRFRHQLIVGLRETAPLMIELRLPGLSGFWSGIWEVAGRETVRVTA